MARPSVVLPEPLSPTRPMVCPRASVSEASRTASTKGFLTRRSLARRAPMTRNRTHRSETSSRGVSCGPPESAVAPKASRERRGRSSSTLVIACEPSTAAPERSGATASAWGGTALRPDAASDRGGTALRPDAASDRGAAAQSPEATSDRDDAAPRPTPPSDTDASESRPGTASNRAVVDRGTGNDPSSRWQRAAWPSAETSKLAGRRSRQTSVASPQRGANTQPAGRRCRSGRSPGITGRWRDFTASRAGSHSRSARV